MLKIYHNPRCRKSRAGLEYLSGKNISFEIREYLKDPFTKTELKEVLRKLGKSPFDIVRRQEDIYKKKLKGKKLTREEWIETLILNPKLIERPLVVSNHKAVLGQPPENIDKLL